MLVGGERLPEPVLEQLLALNEVRVLDWHDPTIDDARLARLAGLTRLRTLVLEDLRISDGGWIAWEKLPDLRSPTLQNAPIRRAGLRRLANLTKLTTLKRFDVRLDPNRLDALQSLSRLRDLDLRDVSALQTDVLTPGIPRMISDHVLDDHALGFLEGLVRLESLRLQGNTITGSGLRHLKTATKLEAPWLRHAKLGDEELSHLPPLPGLKRLDRARTGITAAGLDVLRGRREL